MSDTCDFQLNLRGRPRMTRLADFLFEVGMLKRTPRTGFQFLGSHRENVAEHGFRTAVIGYILAELAGAPPEPAGREGAGQDADQIDLMVNLKEELDLGNKYALKWLDCAMDRLRTEQGRELARAVRATDHTDWWFLGPERGWWANKHGSDE